MTTTMRDIKRLGLKLALVAGLLAAMPASLGCQNRRDAEASKDLTGIRGEQFVPADEPRQVHRVFDAQAAAGARHDATLYPAHFDGGNPGALNSLGEQKLELMLADDDALPLVVHIDVPEDNVLPAREQAVRVYLRDRGLGDDQVQVVTGENPATYTPAAPKIAAAQRAEAKAAAAGQGGTTGGMTVK